MQLEWIKGSWCSGLPVQVVCMNSISGFGWLYSLHYITVVCRHRSALGHGSVGVFMGRAYAYSGLVLL